MVKLFHDILKLPMPELPSYPNEIKLEFTTDGWDKFLAKLRESMTAKYWIKIGEKKEDIKLIQENFVGLSGLTDSIVKQTKQMGQKINASFTDLDSLKDSATQLVRNLNIRL